jgi:Protein of unknown function (DUF2971)
MDQAADPHVVLNQCLFGYDMQRQSEITDDVRFVHYTSAETAMKIITGDDEKRHFWLRNATEMNDFSEVQYGQFCLEEALRDNNFAERFKTAFNSIDERIVPDFATMVDQELASLKSNTYLLSLSMHRGEELSMGRLSMWRAYGGNANVCLVLNTAAFADQDAYDVVISPVMYGGPAEFKASLEEMLGKIEANREALKALPYADVRDNLQRAIVYAILSSKHPAFKEEEEWRLIYRPSTNPELIPKIVCLDGIVQTVFLLPLENVEIPDGNSVTNATLPELLERIIVGPTPNYSLVSLAFWKLLRDAGVKNPADKIVSCNIPLRR